MGGAWVVGGVCVVGGAVVVGGEVVGGDWAEATAMTMQMKPKTVIGL